MVHSGKELVHEPMQRKYKQIAAQVAAPSGAAAKTLEISDGQATSSSAGRRLLGAGALNRYSPSSSAWPMIRSWQDQNITCIHFDKTRPEYKCAAIGKLLGKDGSCSCSQLLMLMLNFACRYKGFSGWTIVHQRFPNAKFYVCVDDDTYIFVAELWRISRQWRPNQSFIRGAIYSVGTTTNPITGRQFNETSFAHGGEGIIMSRCDF